MTDEQKHLKEHFLEPETRCGFYVDADRKRLWMTEMEMLQSVLDICKEKKYNIWVSDGTLLGAIRHKGYIPWDDDIDLMMPRVDYDKFCRVAQSLLPSGYFLQTQYTDPSFHIPMAKIRKNNTSAIEVNEVSWGYPFHKGIFIDIFPLDVFPTDAKIISEAFCKMSKWQRLRQLVQLPSWRFFEKPQPLKRKLKRLLGCIFRIRFVNALLTRKVESIFSRFLGRKDLPYIFGMGWWNLYSGGNPDCGICTFPQQLFAETIWVPFEYMEVPVPQQARRLLEIEFGEWQQLVRGGACHTELDISFDQDWRTRSIERYGYKKEDFRWFDRVSSKLGFGK